MQARRDKGLCYRCDEKYSPGHRCKNKELWLLVFSDEMAKSMWPREDETLELLEEKNE